MGYDILIVEPNDILRTGLKAIFAADPRVGTVTETMHYGYTSLLREKHFHLVVINQSVVDDMHLLTNERFVMITNDPSIITLKTAYDHGAAGYLTTSVSADLIRIALDLHKDSFLIEPILTPLLMQGLFEARSYSYVKEELLTPREREIVRLLRSGVDRSSIAEHLHITGATLKTHIKNIARKREPIPQAPTLRIS